MLIEQQTTLLPGSPIAGVTRDWLRDRLAAPRDQEVRLHGDVVDRPEVASRDAISASVLVPIVNRPSGATVLLTQRTAHLADHAGQISFPGGRAEPEDAGPVHTALREAEEEVGLGRNHVEIIGLLADYWTITGYRVTPVVGWIEPPFSLNPDSFEVADVFEVPLDFLMDPARHERHSYEYNGGRRQYFAMPYEGRHIWGATAAIIVNLHRILAR
ncbi:MAG: CoA pyrophosphatase [Burkholderiales bacterium]